MQWIVAADPTNTSSDNDDTEEYDTPSFNDPSFRLGNFQKNHGYKKKYLIWCGLGLIPDSRTSHLTDGDEDNGDVLSGGADEPVSYGCFADRRLAIEDSGAGNATYIPDCTPDGRFKKVLQFTIQIVLICYSQISVRYNVTSLSVIVGALTKMTAAPLRAPR